MGQHFPAAGPRDFCPAIRLISEFASHRDAPFAARTKTVRKENRGLLNRSLQHLDALISSRLIETIPAIARVCTYNPGRISPWILGLPSTLRVAASCELRASRRWTLETRGSLPFLFRVPFVLCHTRDPIQTRFFRAVPPAPAPITLQQKHASRRYTRSSRDFFPRLNPSYAKFHARISNASYVVILLSFLPYRTLSFKSLLRIEGNG